MKNKTIYIIFFLTFFLLSCANNLRTTNFIGSYIRKDNENDVFKFSAKYFSLVESPKFDITPYVCCDTITKGFWELDNKRKLIYLYSNYQFENNIKFNCTESKSGTDTIFKFEFNNPIEKIYSRLLTRKKGLAYLLFLKCRKGDSTWFVNKELNGINQIYISKREINAIEEFNFSIIPNEHFRARNLSISGIGLYTNTYTVNDKLSRTFYIDIPDLTFAYIIYKRMNKEVVIIHNRNLIEWDGVNYFKK